tara:strand:- start:618 stop:2192 length:1575 start_codon:yes stop_codon:yes gene_type:complete
LSAHFSLSAPIFNGIELSANSMIVGYAAIIEKLSLPIPMPDQIAVIGSKSSIKTTEDSELIILPKVYQPEDHGQMAEIKALYKHLVFALKYEGVSLLVFAALSKHYSSDQLSQLVGIEPTGQYSRRIWFIIEWILGYELPNTQSISKSKKSYVDALDTRLQFAVEGEKSSRHLVINNFPGTRGFCPLVRKSEQLQGFVQENIAQKKNEYLEGIRKDILLRASAFLMLKDSKASFSIEGESPKSKRAALWGNAIGQAGMKPLNRNELIRLQQLVIENPRFISMGYRQEGGFVGEHDRDTGEPIPDHISARHEDLEQIMGDFIEASKILIKSSIDPVVAAAALAFGFVFIHPFEDGNGRIHRYLIHHVLAQKQFSQQGVIFPVSAAILKRIDSYRKVLEHYSHPLLHFIEWERTENNNVKVLNDTIDYYRYFDATHQAEYLYQCVRETLETIIPEELSYLHRFEEFKSYLDNEFEMPDKLVSLLIRFLEQNGGELSKRARVKEFNLLTDAEVIEIEKNYRQIFLKG